jgi:hypothetical protein
MSTHSTCNSLFENTAHDGAYFWGLYFQNTGKLQDYTRSHSLYSHGIAYTMSHTTHLYCDRLDKDD